LKRILISIFAVAFAFSAMALAGEGVGCNHAAKKAEASPKTKAGCCAAKTAKASSAMAAQVAQDEAGKAAQIAQDESGKAPMEGHVCPDVEGQSALMNFHETMHPLHMALGANDIAAVREGLPNLLKASKTMEKYKCEGYENCPKDERKSFDRNKKELLNAVKDLKKACKGKDDAKVTASFDKMHEAYITFANTCVR
jgi:hypothetical protein